MMKIRGVLAEILLEIDPEKCKDFVIGEFRNKVFHARVKGTLRHANGEHIVLK